MSEFKTVFGSLENYEKGHIEIIDDDPKAYAFSNIFEVANQSAPYEKVVVGKNLKYVIETLRAEGDSDWYTCAHDEFVVCMDGEIEVHLVKLNNAKSYAPDDKDGSVKLKSDPDGPKMGRIILRHGHQALLPKGSAYRFSNRKKPGVLIMQTICGDHSVEKWAEICYS
jgi:hypothetical protein|tara:strand:- start:57 stop:560 length:504 start_codon:yes stop_codon:yes gene_type:complete